MRLFWEIRFSTLNLNVGIKVLGFQSSLYKQMCTWLASPSLAFAHFTPPSQIFVWWTPLNLAIHNHYYHHFPLLYPIIYHCFRGVYEALVVVCFMCPIQFGPALTGVTQGTSIPSLKRVLELEEIISTCAFGPTTWDATCDSSSFFFAMFVCGVRRVWL